MDPARSGTCMFMTGASDVASEVFTYLEQVFASSAYLQHVSKSCWFLPCGQHVCGDCRAEMTSKFVAETVKGPTADLLSPSCRLYSEWDGSQRAPQPKAEPRGIKRKWTEFYQKSVLAPWDRGRQTTLISSFFGSLAP